MGRVERNARRKARRRTIIFSLLAIILLFVAGIGAANRVMVQMTGLSPEYDILSSQSINAYAEFIRGVRSEIRWIADAEKIIKGWLDEIQKAVGELASRI